MDIANQVKIERMRDHFVVRLSVRHSIAEGATDETVATVASPVTTAIDMALDIFASVPSSAVDNQGFFLGLQDRINAINSVSQSIKEDNRHKQSG